MKQDRFSRLTEIVTTAAGLSGSKRRAFLTDACGGDPALKKEAESISFMIAIKSVHAAMKHILDPLTVNVEYGDSTLRNERK